MDEAIVGAEYEVIQDLRVGFAYKNRRLSRILEDLSSDGGDSYFIGNPGHFTQAQEEALIRQIEALRHDQVGGELSESL